MATDQEIRDAGFKYIPQQKYLQNPFQIPTTDDSDDDGGGGGGGGGIPFTNAGSSFSVYNPDPNSIANKNYSPYAYNKAMRNTNKFGQTVGPNPDLYYSTPLKGIPGAIQKYVKNSFLGKGFGVARDFLNNMLPTNTRAILENELSGQGIMVDDIGRIVQGEGAYNTAQNIMAGYNASMIDADTIQGRIDTVSDSLGEFDKYDPNSPQFDVDKYNQMKDKIAALKEYAVINDIALDKTDSIIDSEEEEDKEKKKNIIERLFLNTKKTTDTTTTDDTTTDDTTTTDGTTTGGMYTGDSTGAPSGFGITAQGNFVNQFEGGDPGQNQGGTTSNGTKSGGHGYQGSTGSHHLADGGRAGYFYGGRIGFQGGGSDASSDDFVTSTSTPGPGDTGGEGGTNPSDGSDTQFGGGGNNDGENNNPPVTMVNNKPVDISTVTKSIGDYEIPYGLEALMSDKGRLQAVLNADNVLNKNLGLDFTYDKGPYQIGFNADMEGNKNLGLSYNKGNLSAYANTNFNNPSVGFKYSRAFAYGGLASIL